MKISENRFRVIMEGSNRKTKEKLNVLGYEELDQQVTDSNRKTNHLFIDSKRSDFWTVDDEALKQCIDFAESVYNQVVITITI